jgi:DHA1 family inner membrane transport protein
MVLGRFIDKGHARRAAWISTVVCIAVVALKASAGDSATLVVTATLVANAFGGLYLPTLMTGVYNDAKTSNCAFQYHFALDAVWDIGGILACGAALVLLIAGAPLQAILLLAIPAHLLQGFLLSRGYAATVAPAAAGLVASPVDPILVLPILVQKAA